MAEAEPLEFLIRHAPKILAEGLDLPAIGAEECREHGEECRFAATAGPHEQIHLAFAQLERNVVDRESFRLAGAEAAQEIKPLEGWPCRHDCCRYSGAIGQRSPGKGVTFAEQRPDMRET